MWRYRLTLKLKSCKVNSTVDYSTHSHKSNKQTEVWSLLCTCDVLHSKHIVKVFTSDLQSAKRLLGSLSVRIQAPPWDFVRPERKRAHTCEGCTIIESPLEPGGGDERGMKQWEVMLRWWSWAMIPCEIKWKAVIGCGGCRVLVIELDLSEILSGESNPFTKIRGLDRYLWCCSWVILSWRQHDN